MEQLEFLVEPSQAGQRLDKFLAAAQDRLSRSALQNLLEEELILCNGKPANKKYTTRAGDEILVQIPPAQPLEAVPQNIPLDIYYEDPHLLVVYKPKGMVVHPAPGNPDGTLVNALLYHCAGELSGIGGQLRPGIVHRIDKDTSGLLVVAKDDPTHQELSRQMSVHSINRIYQAVCYGGFKEDSGFVEAPIGRHPLDRKKMAITPKNSRYAYTGWEVVERLGTFTHIQCKLKTGRTHQIRVHMASIGHPLAGDPVYGPQKVIKELEGQCLHAGTLGFVHPATGEYMEFNAPLPEYFEKFLKKLRGEGS